MDFRYVTDNTTSGGSDGCIDFNDVDNAGLDQCLTNTNVASVYDKYCDVVSLADFIVIAAESVMGRTAADYNAAAPFTQGTLLQKWRDNFRSGRTTAESCTGNVGLMPNPEDGCTGLKNIFVDHIYKSKSERKSWMLTAAVSGAHTLGGAKQSQSGYDGHWSDAESQGKFNNDYYKSLITKGWGAETAFAGNPKKNQWSRIDQPCAAHRELMLNTDICLAYQHNADHQACMKTQQSSTDRRTQRRADRTCKKFQKTGDFIFAQNATCCAWTAQSALFSRRVFQRG